MTSRCVAGATAGQPKKPKPVEQHMIERLANRASKVAGLKLAQVVEGTDPLPKKPSTLAESSERFLTWITDARLESQTKRYYRNGWRMLKTTAVVNMSVDEITNDYVESLKFHGSAANTNCALRTLRRMLYKA